jgi:hypothetical protein
MRRHAVVLACSALLACSNGKGKGKEKSNSSSEAPLGPALVGVAFGAGFALLGALDEAGMISFDNKKEQCERMIAGMNRAVEGMRNLDPSGTPESIRAVATQFDNSANELAAIPLTDAELVKKRGEYVAMVRDTASAMRELAAAIQALDVERMGAIQTKLSTVTAREDTLVDSINQYCGAK